MPVENVTELPLDRVTLGDAMKGAGYATALFGKWHLGQTGKHHPSQRGFDDAVTTMGKHFDFVTQPKADVPEGGVPRRLADRPGRRVRRTEQG